MKRVSWPLSFVAGSLFIFLYLPILVVVIFSFNSASRGVEWKGFTAQWYRLLLENQQVMDATKNTFLLAAISTLLATVLGTMLGYGLHRYRFRGKSWVAALLYLPVFIPDIVMAVALVSFYALVRRWLGWFDLGLRTMILAQVTFQISFVAIVVRARLTGLDPALEEAARDLGANGWQTFWHVTFPLIVPGVLAGAALAFTLSLDDFVVSFFTSGPGSTTIPIFIYSSVKRGVTPEINALSTLIVLASIAGAVAVTRLQRKRNG